MIQPMMKTGRKPDPISIDYFEGVDKSASEFKISINQFSDCRNIVLDDFLTVDSRSGFKRVFTDSLGLGKVNGVKGFRKADDTIEHLMAHGTKLYRWVDGSAPEVIFDGLADHKVAWYKEDKSLFILDGTTIWEYDGITVVDISTNALVPLLTMGRSPDGSGGNAYQDVNLIGKGFKDSFSADGTSKDYYLSIQNLDADLLKIWYNGNELVETTNFTVNRVTGKVTFLKNTYTKSHFGDGATKIFATGMINLEDTFIEVYVDGVLKTITTDYTVDYATGIVTFVAAPAAQAVIELKFKITAPNKGTDNVIIQGYKTFEGYKDKICKCTIIDEYGGENDTRYILSGNPGYPAICFYSGLKTIYYWPTNSYEPIANKSESVTGVIKQYDLCVIVKEYDATIMDCQLDDNGKVYYPTKPINDTCGCIAPGSLKLVGNSPVFLSEDGLVELIQTTVRSQLNKADKSQKVDVDLLKEANVRDAIAVVFDKKYILCMPSGVCYVWDTRYVDQKGQPIWYIWDNIHASCFEEIEDMLYFGSSSEGLVYRFYKNDEDRIYNDDGAAIDRYLDLKFTDCGTDRRYKNIPVIQYSLKPATRASVDMTFITEKPGRDKVYTSRMDLWDFNDYDFEQYSFTTNTTPKPVTHRINIAQRVYVKFRLRNNRANEAFGVNSIKIDYELSSEVR